MNKLFTKIAAILSATMAVGVGVAAVSSKNPGVLKAAEGDELAICQGTGSGYGTRRTLTDSHSVGWVLASSQSGYLGTNNATNHNKVKPTNDDLPVVKAVKSDATTNTTGYYFYYTTTPVANVGSLNFSHTATNQTAICKGYVVSCDTLASSGSKTWSTVTMSSTSVYDNGSAISLSGKGAVDATFTFNSTNSSSLYYGLIIEANSCQRFTAGTITLLEGSSGGTELTETETTIQTPAKTQLDLATQGDSVTLSASVEANGSAVAGASVTWGSSQASVATVGQSTGVVTPVAVGQTVITATYAGDNTTYAGSSDTITITVIDSDAETFELVTSDAGLVSGKEYVISDSTKTYFMAGQGNNNRSSVTGSVANDVVTFVSTMERITISELTTGIYELKATSIASGYLYAAGASSNNYLRTEAEHDSNKNSKFSISISSGVATILAQGSGSRKDMRFNSASDQLKFSCYATTSTSPKLSLWKKTGTDKCATPVLTFNDNARTITWPNVAGAVSYKLSVDSTSEQDFITTTSPYSVSSLGDGEHTIYVRAIGDGTNYLNSDLGQVTFTITTPTTVDSVVISGAPQSEITNAEYLDTINLTAAITKTGPASVSLSWTSSNESVATVTGNSSSATVTIVGNGSTTITAQADYPGTTTGSNTATASISISNLKGSIDNPYTVSEAIALIGQGETAGPTGICVTGIVSSIEQEYSSQYHNISFNISSDGTTSGQQLEAFRCVGTTSYPIDSSTSVLVGDQVKVSGNIILYQSTTYELAQGCKLEYLYRVTPVNSLSISGTGIDNNAISIGSEDLSAHTVNVTINSDASDKQVNISHYSGDNLVSLGGLTSGHITCSAQGSGSFTITGSGATSGTETIRIISNSTASQYVDLVITAVNGSIQNHTVTFNSNGGSVSPTALTVQHGDTFTFPSAGTKSGNTFAGWSSDGGTTKYAVDATSPAVDDDVTYTAYWTTVQTQSFTAVFGETTSSGSGSSTELVDANASKLKTDYNYTVDSEITFSGLSKIYPADGKWVKIGSSSSVGYFTLSIPTVISSKAAHITNVKVTAANYTNKNCGVEVVSGSTNGHESVSDTLDVYTFDISSENSCSVQVKSYSGASDKRLFVQKIELEYALASATTYSVTYLGNGGTGETVDQDSPYLENTQVTVLANNFAKTGYSFVNWTTGQDGSGTSYNPGDTFSITGNVTLYAQWTEGETSNTVTWTRDGSTDTYSTGYEQHKADGSADNSGFYKDSSTGVNVGVKRSNSAAMWTTNVPSVRSLTVKVGGGTVKDPLDNNVYAYFLDENYDVISSSQTLVTTKAESQTGTEYTVDMPRTENVYGITITHTKETSYNIRIFGLSFEYYGTESSILSGVFDFNSKQSLYVDDAGDLVVKVPENCSICSYAGDTNEDILLECTDINTTTHRATFSFITTGTATADVDVAFYWHSSNYEINEEVHETIQVVNPTGLAAARAYAADINACCGSGSEMSGLWSLLAEDWDSLAAEAKAFLLDATYTIEGTYPDEEVIKGDATHNELAKAMSRYDYMVERLGMTNFMQKQGLSSGGRIVNILINQASSSTTAIIVVTSMIGLSAVGGYFFLRKRKEI